MTPKQFLHELTWIHELVQLPPIRNSSADPLYFAGRKDDGWHSYDIWSFGRPPLITTDGKAYATKELLMASMVRDPLSGPDPIHVAYGGTWSG